MVDPFTLWIHSWLTFHRSPSCMRCFRRVIDVTEDAQERRYSFPRRRSSCIARSSKQKGQELGECEEIHSFQRIRVLCRLARSDVWSARSAENKSQEMVPEEDGARLMTYDTLWFVLTAWLTFNDARSYLGTTCNHWRNSATAKSTLMMFVPNSEREQDARAAVQS